MMYAGTILSALCSGTYEAAEPLCVVSLRAEGSTCSYCVVCSYYEAYGIREFHTLVKLLKGHELVDIY